MEQIQRFGGCADEGKSPRRAEKLELHERRSGAGEPWFQRRKREHVLASCELFQEEITKNRAYVLANELAKVKGEAFEMPERSTKYGVFVDNQGTGSVYSLLCTQQGVNGSDEAVISIYRQGELKGSFVDNGNGELEFSSEDGSVKGIIQINGWDGASFEVTETSNPDSFPVGQKTEFPFAF